jgi:hypothetical protein
MPMTWLALLLAVISSGACYLSTDHQRFLTRPLAPQPARVVAAVAAVLCVIVWCGSAGVSAGIVSALTALCAGGVSWVYAGGARVWLVGTNGMVANGTISDVVGNEKGVGSVE